MLKLTSKIAVEKMLNMQLRQIIPSLSTLTFVVISIVLSSFCPSALAQEEMPLEVAKLRGTDEENQKKLKAYEEQKETKDSRARLQKYQFTYIDRRHTFAESFKLIAAMYGVTWAVYPLSQPKVFRDKGSWSRYKDNLGKLVFDQDEPFWNWFVHPISGSQLYLFYRANGYSRINAMGMAFLSSALFEFTVEIYTEPASVQDLYQTPVLGSMLGVGIETLSMYLLNTGNSFGRAIGHIINPTTLFWFYEGKIQIVPQTNFRDSTGLLMTMEF